MRYLPLALAGLLVAASFANTAVAQTPPPAPGIGAPPAPGAAPPPPPPGPDAAGPDAPPSRGPGAPPPPPPPRGADIRFDRGPGTDLHLHVHCAESDSTKTCADIADQLIDKLHLAVQTK